MKSQLLAATAVALFAFAPASAQAPKPAKPTPAEAKAFVDKAEAELAAFNQYVAKSAWVRATYITEDTQWLEAKAVAEQNELTARYAREAARFDGVAADPVTARKLKLLKLFLVSPAPDRPGAASELATIATRLDSTFSAGKFQHGGKTLTLNDAEEILAKSRDPAELKAVWEGWHSVAPQMRGDYAKLAQLSNEGARDLGFKDTGALWRSSYDMDPDKFAAETDRLWNQVEPFYRNLHCYVRGQLNDKYGDAVQPRTGPIRADLLGNMWAQQWGNVYDVVQPKTASSSYSLDKLLVSKGYDPVKMVKTGESFYTSVGISPLPETFWQRSMITRPKDREVVCHASAWDLDDRDDVRIKMCTKVDGDDFYTVHHELGHNVYQRAYKDQPFLFKNGANDGFHEAIGDFVGLSALTPTYLQQIGLLDKAPGADEDIPFLLKMALDKIAFLPFGLMVDRWRWEVFSGEATPERYNDEWWKLRLKYQGLAAPGPRPADAFDAGAKYHVPANVPYTRYFLAHIYQFQFHRAACNQIGWKGPLHRCSVYGEKEMGQKFNTMLEMGASKPWPEAMAAFTGEKDADASAVTAYFKPLNDWLTVQNKGESCGW
ncbi:peptidyl-dipeptidase [Phenylobacterium sp. Root77]|jgi:peptidyl-dipeptidase A|uniref:M2 family metallopeptidase n=1 Tax=unclassified Phenylobacterium TaxID=2640670 RepID=UPI0006FBC721|nr:MULTISPECIES: M2 family metallopeptidase [unclassified Phenylobacterium]KQW73461.1 peptidyl-dipeptidase [Phenylobacterium sp. Root1277]KQW92680.1 peptidyl-dipeptidase [Phenylobacterium sp. Root1290]KRC40908.1 peptidyl-dipeptidase [Phenylobacterium sp. Root77]